MHSVYMWTDGGQDGGNPANGAGIAVFVSDNKVRVVGEPLGYCTNNFAEASAVAAGLKILSAPCNIMLFTDSQYVINGIKRLKRGSMLNTNVPAWERVQSLILTGGHKFSGLEHTRGHSEDPVNNLADIWASWCAASQKPIDRTYGSLEEALKDAPSVKYRKKKHPSKNRAWEGSRRGWSSY
jgi:ribonuclease HI